MIVSIEGTLLESSLLHITVESHGLGYELLVPLTTVEKLPGVGERVRLHTLAVYREDSQTLYGFATRQERDFFRLLIEKVSGIGPKTALSILSRLSVPLLQQAIAQSDVALLSKCPGIGKKTAERLVVELRDVLGAAVAPAAPALSGAPADAQASPFADAVAALVALGFKPADADKSIRQAQHILGADASSEALIRKAFSGN